MPYFHLFPFVLSEQYGEGEISQVSSLFMHNIFFHYDMYLLCILWKTIEHDQPLFCLALSCFFPLTLILCTLLNFLYSCYLRLESQKGYINSGPTHCIKTVLVAMKIDELGFVADTKSIFHQICKNILFIQI